MCGQGRGGGLGRTLGGGEQGDRGNLLLWGKVAPNIKRTEFSVPVASVQGLEQHHPTMIMLWKHGDWVKIKREEKICVYINREIKSISWIPYYRCANVLT